MTMIELLLLVSSVWAIVTRARQREVDPTSPVVGALSGWILFLFLGMAGVNPILALILRWACVGSSVLVAEFAPPDPSLRQWWCPECRAWNPAEALTCSCRRVRPDLRG